MTRRAPTNLRPHAKGTVFDLLTEVTRRRRAGVGGDLDVPPPRQAATRSATGRPRRSRTSPPAASSGGCRADLGRRYAAVSGDRNPIHLYPLTAKALGFPRQIAHGMWSKARCVAALENRLPDAVTRRGRVQEADPPARHGRLRVAPPADGRLRVLAEHPKTGAPHLPALPDDPAPVRHAPAPTIQLLLLGVTQPSTTPEHDERGDHATSRRRPLRTTCRTSEVRSRSTVRPLSSQRDRQTGLRSDLPPTTRLNRDL